MLTRDHTPASTGMGDCPICWTEVDLNTAGRIRPHMFMLHRCDGAGSLPRTNALERRIHAEVPERIRWWQRPTCQVCNAHLIDEDDNPCWDVTSDITFICRNGYHVNEGPR